jgi:hypothetical protein
MKSLASTAITYDFVGRVHLDSLELYRKYKYEEMPQLSDLM